MQRRQETIILSEFAARGYLSFASFIKDEILTVIRRIDSNWAEGKLADKIGIFPISFVEVSVSGPQGFFFSLAHMFRVVRLQFDARRLTKYELLRIQGNGALLWVIAVIAVVISKSNEFLRKKIFYLMS